ncbi:hypothetical protein TraAM80_05292 [Trypanosoma rangeli]|uniref:CCHC-type domain-containing protein n=1 Tax=Trypanosoma rangeli TaxID=5698 RepID=A0A3R7NL08_TRYRA|nr:uncharacterized protein TraAM80_05292 [Trypanosoma rangeli]RNF04187.1 hypothetical protein TraAM80_05292 [Trypanosoma rangeli]|eukprot:RNF04187.1 hypothetical protein TraAM80_05292 [Trypanosoma rangeli]
MSRRCFMVYPLPTVADESFLNVVFDGGVRRSVFAGCGSRRFALVELQDDACAEAVALALGTAPLSPYTNSSTIATSRGDIAEEDRTLEELFRAHVAAAEKKSGTDVPNADTVAKGGATPSCIAHLNRLRFRDTPIHVLPSPIALEEIYSCGGQLPQHLHKNKANTDRPHERAGKKPLRQKRHRTPAEGAAISSGEPAVTAEGRQGRGGGATASSAVDACGRCGSTDHFTRHCNADGRAAVKELARLQSHPGCEDNSDGVAAAHAAALQTEQDTTWRQEPPKATMQQQQQQRPTALRRSKDQCKYCGSDAHLSRHCPSK